MNSQEPGPFGDTYIGKTMIILGSLFIILGLLFLYRDKLTFLKFLGHLPGDIAIKKENFSFYFPITTSLLISAILSLLFWFLRR